MGGARKLPSLARPCPRCGAALEALDDPPSRSPLRRAKEGDHASATTACPAATDQERGRMTLPGSSESDARHRCRRPVSGHGTALLRAHPNGTSA